MKWMGKNVSVVGLGKSNQALVRYLTRQGATVTARDRKSAAELGRVYDHLNAMGVDFELGPKYLVDLELSDAVFVAPGIRKDLPEILEARRRRVPITSETNLFLDHCKAPVIGITGSSGKTTTTTLVGAILEAAGLKVFVGGNIGRPLIDIVDDIPESAIVVLELSSFQLELATRSPRIAIVTNISPNHLDVHGDMAAYVEAKSRIYEYQTDQDLLVLNRDDPCTRAMADEARSRVIWFSRRGEVDDGAFACDGRVMLSRHGRTGRTLEEVCATADIPLLGGHNLENVLAACAVGHLLGATAGTMRDVVTSFTGVAHRLELVRESGGVRYYNDSIATSPSRAIAGLKAFDQRVLLIAGGYDKELPFDEFAEAAMDRAAALFLIGEAAPKIAAAVREVEGGKGSGRLRLELCETLDEAVRLAKDAACPGDIVLLSPACASYDMFTNFEARGERFRKLVHSLTEEDVPQAHEVT